MDRGATAPYFRVCRLDNVVDSLDSPGRRIVCKRPAARSRVVSPRRCTGGSRQGADPANAAIPPRSLPTGEPLPCLLSNCHRRCTRTGPASQTATAEVWALELCLRSDERRRPSTCGLGYRMTSHPRISGTLGVDGGGSCRSQTADVSCRKGPARLAGPTPTSPGTTRLPRLRRIAACILSALRPIDTLPHRGPLTRGSRAS